MSVFSVVEEGGEGGEESEEEEGSGDGNGDEVAVGGGGGGGGVREEEGGDVGWESGECVWRWWRWRRRVSWEERVLGCGDGRSGGGGGEGLFWLLLWGDRRLR